MSVAWNSHLTNKPEANGALILPPSLYRCSILWVFKATLSYTERKEVKRRICGHTWELNSGPPAKKTTHKPTALILSPGDCSASLLGFLPSSNIHAWSLRVMLTGVWRWAVPGWLPWWPACLWSSPKELGVLLYFRHPFWLLFCHIFINKVSVADSDLQLHGCRG